MKVPKHPNGVLFYTLTILSVGTFASLLFTALPFWYHWLSLGFGFLLYLYMSIYAWKQKTYEFIIATTALLIFVAVWFYLSEPSYTEWYNHRPPGTSRFL